MKLNEFIIVKKNDSNNNCILLLENDKEINIFLKGYYPKYSLDDRMKKLYIYEKNNEIHYLSLNILNETINNPYKFKGFI
jgi:hypothetical protein